MFVGLRSPAVRVAIRGEGGWVVEQLGETADTASLAIATTPGEVCPYVAWVERSGGLTVASPGST